MRRGTIVWVNLGDVAPPEFGKTRPAIVVSNSVQNEILGTIVVIPLSTRPGEIWPLRIELDLPSGKRSYAVLPGIRQVNKMRLMDPMGTAPEAFMRSLDKALTLYLMD